MSKLPYAVAERVGAALQLELNEGVGDRGAEGGRKGVRGREREWAAGEGRELVGECEWMVYA